MPAPAPGSKILVTGTNGYIGIWVVRRLLEKGYSVRGTVRSASKAEHLKQTFSSYGDKHEVVIVEDITKEGAFDEAVKGVDAIEHTASPFRSECDDPKEFIEPAVKGTVRVLESALKYGTGVKRIVVTSSSAAVLHLSTTPKTFSELDWNEQAIKDVEDNGRNALTMNKYNASKTLAERAAWEFVEKHKGSIGWDLVVLNPPYVFGPPIHAVPAADQLNTSMQEFYDTVVKGAKDDQTLGTLGSCWIDVRDLGLAHVLAMEKEEAGGNRFIVSAGTFKWQDFVDVANSLNPPIHPPGSLPKGIPGSGSAAPGAVHIIEYDTRKAAKILGMDKYLTKEDVVRDSLADFKARGW